MKELFVARDFKQGALDIIEHANDIIAEYRAQGFTLTLRQLYYQFVSRDLLKNVQTEYKRLGSVINDARLAGLIDWSAIEDRTRNVRKAKAWDSPESIVGAVADQYQENLWRGQKHRVQVWIEKDALVGVIEPVCLRWRMDYFACRGYTSQSEQYAAGKYFADLIEQDITPVVLHLGDHDPSGIDMTRDNADRLSMFAGEQVTVKRLALNIDQVRQYNPPPNPAKDTDSRATGYVEKFGDKSWELDALEPTVIDKLISDAITKLVDPVAWATAVTEEKNNKGLLEDVSEHWNEVTAMLEDMR